MVEGIKEALGLEQLWIVTSPKWASSQADHRRKLRQSLQEFFSDYKIDPQELEKLTHLDKIPQTSQFSISISHCPEAGGFAIAPKPINIGFDIELIARIKPDSVARICSNQEVESAPGISSLWVAKESAFKALLGPNQPKLISDIEISRWERIDNNVITFHYSSPNIKHLRAITRGGTWLQGPLKLGLSTLSA